MSLGAKARSLVRVPLELGQTLRAIRRNAVFHRPAPPADGLVLDVGSGQAPHARADVVVDKYVADDFERGSPLDLRKPLVVADGHALPFVDDAFAYVIASHVLEHATDPHAFAAELSRTSEAGFVQVPGREAELTFGWAFHPWLIDQEGALLIFHPRGDQPTHLEGLFHRLYDESLLFQLWFASTRDLWHHSLHWRNSFAVGVEGTSQAPATAALDVERTLDALPRMGARGPTGAVREALRCPADRGRLDTRGQRLTCAACECSYPVSAGVPVLLAEAAA